MGVVNKMKWVVIKDYQYESSVRFFDTYESAKAYSDEWINDYKEMNLDLKTYICEVKESDEAIYDENREWI